MAVDMANEKLITKEDAILRIKPEDIDRLFYPVIDARVDRKSLESTVFAHGINAVPAQRLERSSSRRQTPSRGLRRRKGDSRSRETSPEDVGGMAVAQGILTATGGKTSHAAVVARGWGKCCIVGAEKVSIDYKSKTMSSGGKTVKEGEWVTLDGGKVSPISAPNHS